MRGDKGGLYCHPDVFGPQVEVLNKHLFLTAKPVIYLVNLSERDYIRKKNKWYIHKNRCLCVECIQLSSNIAANVQCVCKWQRMMKMQYIGATVYSRSTR